MRFLQKFAAIVIFVLGAQIASAQSWVQVEALPTQARALERAAEYASRLPDVNAFRLNSGWHAIALGPYTEDRARLTLLQLRGSRSVPSDAYVSDGRGFRDQVFGSGEAPETTQTSPLPPLVPGEESVAEARKSERQLSREERAQIQIALKWEGIYTSVIDASFGRGTRRAMATWQEVKRYEPTGVLTTLQRRELVDSYHSVLNALGLRTIIDDTAGIQIDLPAGMVEFDRYEPPFAHYKAATDIGVRVVLISQTGDLDTLGAMYDIIQTLEIVPLDGARNLERRSFTIEAESADIQSYTFAQLSGETVKGFMLVWPAGDEKRFRLALSRMHDSFVGLDGALPDTAGSGLQDIDLLSGLEIRRAERSSSGFYIDSAGSVLTTTNAVQNCARITLDEESDAHLQATDETLGLALLTPEKILAPLSVARLASARPRLKSDVAVAGYSFGGLLSAPSVTYGTLADLKDLSGDDRVQRLEVASEPGDAGGPVFDKSGAVLGMLLPAPDSSRTLPRDVAFAADAPVLAEFLSKNGVNPAAADLGDAMAPEDLTLLAADLTVLVSCWN